MKEEPALLLMWRKRSPGTKLPYQQEAGQEANTKTCSNGQTIIANLGSNRLR